jgi:hypothetical protein
LLKPAQRDLNCLGLASAADFHLNLSPGRHGTNLSRNIAGIGNGNSVKARHDVAGLHSCLFGGTTGRGLLNEGTLDRASLRAGGIRNACPQKSMGWQGSKEERIRHQCCPTAPRKNYRHWQ